MSTELSLLFTSGVLHVYQLSPIVKTVCRSS